MPPVSDPAGLPYAGNGPSVNDDGTPMVNRTRRLVGAGSDTTGPNAGYAGLEGKSVAATSESSMPLMGVGRSAGQNSGTGFAP